MSLSHEPKTQNAFPTGIPRVPECMVEGTKASFVPSEIKEVQGLILGLLFMDN